MDHVIKNYEEPLEKPASTRQFFAYLKHKIKIKIENKKIDRLNKKSTHNHDHNHEHEHEHPAENIPPEGINVVSLAIVLDDVVVDVMNVQESFGDILQKNPKFILVPEDSHRPHQGWIYKDENFISIEELTSQVRPTTRS